MSRWRDRVRVAGDLLTEPEAMRSLELLERPPEEWECDRPIALSYRAAHFRTTVGAPDWVYRPRSWYYLDNEVNRHSKIPPRPFSKKGYAAAEALAKKRRG